MRHLDPAYAAAGLAIAALALTILIVAAVHDQPVATAQCEEPGCEEQVPVDETCTHGMLLCGGCSSGCTECVQDRLDTDRWNGVRW